MGLFIQKIWLVLSHKSFLWILLFINLSGTVFGYDWYMWQLKITEPKFWIFVPDSPTASLFFTLAIIGWLIGRNFKLIEALALITLVKYGLMGGRHESLDACRDRFNRLDGLDAYRLTFCDGTSGSIVQPVV